MKKFLNTTEAKEYLGFSKAHLYKLTSKNKIPHYKKGKMLYFLEEELEAWILSGEIEVNKNA